MFAQRNSNYLLKLATTLIVMLNLVVVNVISTEDSNNRNSDSLLSSDWEIDEQQVEPRQYFKINVAPKKIQRSKQAIDLINRRATASTSDSAISQSQDQPNSSPVSPGSKQKISNATLKKLLNQSLLKSTTSTNSSSSTASSGPNKSNFKFVFIQRATAAPGSIKSQQPSSSQQTLSSTQQPSLAASVSRQLASSLLKSAVDIVADNLESAKPSLSALASQLAATNSISDVSNSGSSIKKSQFESSSQADSFETKKKTQSSSVGSDKQKGSSGSIKTKGSSLGKVKQPSKIYNLPVKFVSNGQPNHVVFSTIKQHFATIKKMQQAAAAATATKGSSLLNQSFNHKNSANGGKRRKQQQHQKLKGNSRLIYLPLKYLSNARPNKIISQSSSPSSSLAAATLGGTKSSTHKLTSSFQPNSNSTSS